MPIEDTIVSIFETFHWRVIDDAMTEDLTQQLQAAFPTAESVRVDTVPEVGQLCACVTLDGLSCAVWIEGHSLTGGRGWLFP